MIAVCTPADGLDCTELATEPAVPDLIAAANEGSVAVSDMVVRPGAVAESGGAGPSSRRDCERVCKSFALELSSFSPH